MKEIKCIYQNGEEKIFTDDRSKKAIKNLLIEIKDKKSKQYLKFINSPLEKAYIDGELVIDKEKIQSEV